MSFLWRPTAHYLLIASLTKTTPRHRQYAVVFFMKQHCLTSQGAYRTIIYTPFWAENAIF
jgi:hypothetical protein